MHGMEMDTIASRNHLGDLSSRKRGSYSQFWETWMDVNENVGSLPVK
jgi:hypothetical protein